MNAYNFPPKMALAFSNKMTSFEYNMQKLDQYHNLALYYEGKEVLSVVGKGDNWHIIFTDDTKPLTLTAEGFMLSVALNNFKVSGKDGIEDGLPWLSMTEHKAVDKVQAEVEKAMAA